VPEFIQEHKPTEKPSIETRKKAFIQIIENEEGYSSFLNNLIMIFDSFSEAEFFSRKDIMEVCSIQVSSAGEILSKLKESKVIEPVVGHGNMTFLAGLLELKGKDFVRGTSSNVEIIIRSGYYVHDFTGCFEYGKNCWEKNCCKNIGLG